MKFEYLHRYAIAARLVSGKDVLNISSGGDGYGSRMLARTASSVIELYVGQDVAGYAIGAHADVANLRFLNGSSGDIPVDDHSVDVVATFEALDVQAGHDQMLKQVKRVLRPGGLLLFAAMNTSLASGDASIQQSLNMKAVDFAVLSQLLQSHFQHVEVYAQRANMASFIYPFEFDGHAQPLQYAQEFGQQDAPQSGPDAALYYFAVASDEALPSVDRIASVHSNLTAGPDGYALYALMEHLTQLYAELDASRRAIATVQASKVWKVRDAWLGMRDPRAWLTALTPPIQTALWSLTYGRPSTKYSIPVVNSVATTLVPPLQKFLWGLTYNRLTAKMPSPEMTFMNLGFVGGADDPRPTLDPADETDRPRIQMYHHVATLGEVSGRDVLEIGCGRGGGASYIKRYLGPSTVVGMDLAEMAIDFCRRTHTVDGLRFVQGDAEKVPFEDGKFDVVVNVESSHCYPSLSAFYREVKRVLRPGGHFLYVDIMPSEQLAERRTMLARAGLEIVRERDITANVLASLDSHTDQRVVFEQALTSVFGRAGAREWSMLPGSQTLDGLRNGTLSYVSMAVRSV